MIYQKTEEVLGTALFNALPDWAKALKWVLGAPEKTPGDGFKEPCVVISQHYNKAIFTIIGEENLLGGVCDCCVGGFTVYVAHASLALPEYTIPGLEPAPPPSVRMGYWAHRQH